MCLWQKQKNNKKKPLHEQEGVERPAGACPVFVICRLTPSQQTAFYHHLTLFSSHLLPHHHYGDYCTTAVEIVSLSSSFIFSPSASVFPSTQPCPLNDRISSGLWLKSSQLSILSLLRACLIAHQSSSELPQFAKQHFKANWNKKWFTLKHTFPTVAAKELADKQLYNGREVNTCPRVNFPFSYYRGLDKYR